MGDVKTGPGGRIIMIIIVTTAATTITITITIIIISKGRAVQEALLDVKREL